MEDVVEEMEVDQSFRIQSVSVIPKHAHGNSESVYAADASNLDEVREGQYLNTVQCHTFCTTSDAIHYAKSSAHICVSLSHFSSVR